MRKLILFLVAFTALFVNQSSSSAAYDLSEEGLKQNGLNQIESKETFDQFLQTNHLTEDEIKKIGNFYYDERGNIIIQVKSDFYSNLTTSVNVELLKENNHLRLESVKYSFEELARMQDLFFDKVKHLNLSKDSRLSINTKDNGLTLKASVITAEQQEAIKKIYNNEDEDFLQFEINPHYEDVIDWTTSTSKEATIASTSTGSRTTNFSHLGAGIAYKLPNGNYCTTAGIAYKNNDYFLITAGHCLNLSGMYRQYNAPIGQVHMTSTQYDFGLIKISQSGNLPNGRWATNKLYRDSNKNGYDARIKNVTRPEVGQVVLKSGATTNRTKGIVSNNRTTTIDRKNIIFEIESLGAYGDGGDSGAIVYDEYNNLIGILKGGNQYGYAMATPALEAAQKYNLSIYTADTPKKVK